MINIRKIITLTLAVFCLQFVLLSTISSNTKALDECNGSSAKICKTNATSLSGVIKGVINTLLFVAGMIAVLMIVIGGLRYITSDGDSSRASQAKNTILYALIGLIVAVSSYAIVNFVLDRIF
jgi:hypothetical protein